MNYYRGEIWWARLGDINDTVGSEKAGIRPVVIVSNDLQNCGKTTLITIVPMTSQVHKLYPYDVLVKQGESNLRKAGKICCDQIRTIDKERLTFFIGALSANKLIELNNTIKHVLGV